MFNFLLQKRTRYDVKINTNILILIFFIFAYLHLQGHEAYEAKKAFVFYRKIRLWSDGLYF